MSFSGNDNFPEEEGSWPAALLPWEGFDRHALPKRPQGVRDPYRRLRHGAGVGAKELYQSPLRVGDFSSRGSARRINGLTVRRLYHLMSAAEHWVFLLADFDPEVVDIREQVHLLPVTETATIAADLGIRHPRDRYGLRPISIDLLISFRSGRDLAVEVKARHRDLDQRINPRNWEIQQIKAVWWAARGIDFRAVFQEDLDSTAVRTLHWLQGAGKQGELIPIADAQLEAFAAAFRCAWGRNRTLARILNRMGLEPSFATLRMFRRAAWTLRISLDLRHLPALNEVVRLARHGAYRELLPW